MPGHLQIQRLENIQPVRIVWPRIIQTLVFNNDNLQDTKYDTLFTPVKISCK